MKESKRLEMLYKADWDLCAQRYEAFWACEIIDRPIVQVFAPKRPNLPKGWWRILDESVWADPEPVVGEMLTLFEGIHFAGDAYPMWYPNLGPGTLTACLGNPIRFDVEHDTSWQDHSIENLQTWEPYLDPENPVWLATLRLTKRISECAKNKFVCGIADLGMGIDLLANVRGPDGLCLDLMDDPKTVVTRLADLRKIWEQCYQSLYDLFPIGNGSNCWMPAWALRKSYPLQGDFTCMISPDMFAEIVLPDLQEYCRWLDYPVYHLDGPGALKHLDLILSMPELRAVQWTAGTGQPPMPYWIPMLRQIQKAGKGLFLYVTPEDVEQLMAELRPEGVILNMWASNPADADALVDKVALWR